MKIPNKKISCILLFCALSGLFADKLIPHSHHHNGTGAIADFSSDASQSDPKENEEAGEKIHSEFFHISEISTLSQFDTSKTIYDSLFEINIDFPIPEAPVITLRKYLLLQKIININHRLIRYFTFKAPPVTDVQIIHFKNQNIYRRSYNECAKQSLSFLIG
jgi:hypothetical protein